MIQVAVKFCGGCDPGYERVAYFSKIKAAAGQGFRWVELKEGGYQAILLLSGCPRACPEEDLPGSVPLVSLKSDERDPERVVRMLTEAISSPVATGKHENVG